MISLDPENKCGVFCYKDEKFSILAAGTVNSFFFFFSSFMACFLMIESRKMNTGAVKIDQRSRAFSNLCQILVHVIWPLSVVNCVSR